MSEDYKRFHEANRQSWNNATIQHRSHKPDLIKRFKEGTNVLFPEDVAILGDVRNRQVLHLQCNDGQDTLSIASRLGGIVTGVDISDSAIDFAREMAHETGIPATFIRADIFDWFAQNTQTYDVVYVSYGAINWISDLTIWAQGIARALRPGGHLAMIEFHSLMCMLDLDWKIHFDYMGGMAGESSVGDYVGDDFEGAYQNPHPAYEFAWGLADIITALLDAGLQLRSLREYPFLNGWQRFPQMRAEPNRRFYPPDGLPNLALMFSLTAFKP